jgi:hypothetical protein
MGVHSVRSGRLFRAQVDIAGPCILPAPSLKTKQVTSYARYEREDKFFWWRRSEMHSRGAWAELLGDFGGCPTSCERTICPKFDAMDFDELPSQ